MHNEKKKKEKKKKKKKKTKKQNQKKKTKNGVEKKGRSAYLDNQKKVLSRPLICEERVCIRPTKEGGGSCHDPAGTPRKGARSMHGRL